MVLCYSHFSVHFYMIFLKIFITKIFLFYIYIGSEMLSVLRCHIKAGQDDTFSKTTPIWLYHTTPQRVSWIVPPDYRNVALDSRNMALRDENVILDQLYEFWNIVKNILYYMYASITMFFNLYNLYNYYFFSCIIIDKKNTRIFVLKCCFQP